MLTHIVCDKSNLKICEYHNGWCFYIDNDRKDAINFYKAYEEWSKHNEGDTIKLKQLVNSLLQYPNAMKY